MIALRTRSEEDMLKDILDRIADEFDFASNPRQRSLISKKAYDTIDVMGADDKDFYRSYFDKLAYEKTS